ncbi:unnamed protein product [Clonostachys rhizophaga]|uniref:Glycerophosphocholine acyltransferase 1 n=1 Tax=Clonostachys rhizophaga TaxID=160324 RepID=A0A9N9V488_9HYPO|nr:unnamed protein product [Clonostachys rhizophaga]
MGTESKPTAIPSRAAESDSALVTGGLEGDAASFLSSSPPDESVFDTPSIGPSDARLSRNPSFSGSSAYHDDFDALPPLDRLTVLDLLDNFALPQQLEKLQKGISKQTDKVRRSKDVFKTKTQGARDRMVEEWRRRLPSADEQLERYRKRIRQRVDKLGRQWNDTKTISLREKVSFICGVMNIFISGYLIGGHPELFHLWYGVQLIYFMPIRIYLYQRRGYHYFLADLCYFVNLLCSLSIWVFPSSKRLFVAAYCLAFGNNAVAIIMWRNSLVFHSFDKVTTLFIHIMPCATLHCLVHLFPSELQKVRFPAIYTIKNSSAGSLTAYANVLSMLVWSTLPYAIWQLSYYFFISFRRRDKIAAGRPTSFTWLRQSYSKTWIGKIVLSLPSHLQEPAFMGIQYIYACLTIMPCPLWFFSRYASSIFLLTVFSWSIYNGSTYYIDVFGRRFQKELEAMKREVTKWQHASEAGLLSPGMGPQPDDASSFPLAQDANMSLGASAATLQNGRLNATAPGHVRSISTEQIPLLDEQVRSTTTGIDSKDQSGVQERKVGLQNGVN